MEFHLFEEGPWIWGLFLVGVFVCFFLLAQKDSAALAKVIMRSIISIIISPFLYLKKTISELSLGEANPRLANIDHYLLKRLLIAMQVGLLLSVMVTVGFAASLAVVAFLPPHSLRQGLIEMRHSLQQTETALQQDSATMKAQDSDWQNRRPKLVKQAQDADRQKRADTQATLRSDEAAISRSPEAMQVLNTVKGFFAAHQGEVGATDQAKEFINRIPSLSEGDTKNLISYCDHWDQFQSLSNLSPKTDEQIRVEVQPDHDTLAQKVADETLREPELRSEVNDLQKQVDKSYHPSYLVLTSIASFIFLIFYLWVAGTSIEFFSMAIYLSNDVKQIRVHSENAPVWK